MTDDAPHFDDAGRLIAPKYDDVYFSAQDGLAETQHVFLEGNQLAQRFADMNPGGTFTIGETGFGTGLNFLAAWQLFEQHAPSGTQLDFVSVEGFPLAIEMLQQALDPWPELASYREALLQQWGLIWPGMHRFRFAQGRVRLTLLVGEVVEALRTVDASADAWFLDGFAPSRNAEMWSDTVLAEVARLSGKEATLATYTAAGFVRRGLSAVGFEIEKQPGFGTKRDMTVGCYGKGLAKPAPVDDAIVVGGALAGAFVARALAERGVIVRVVERQALVNGEWPSLSPRRAVLQPKINHADDRPGSRLREGYGYVSRLLDSMSGLAEACDWRACGTFQAAVDERVERRLKRFVEQFAGSGLCRWIDAETTHAECGVALPVGGVVVDRAGVLRPAGLCVALLDHANISVHDGVEIDSIQRQDEQWAVRFCEREHVAIALVLASALDARRFDTASHLDLRPVRGQVTMLREEAQSGTISGLKRAIFYGGYALPACDGVQMLGASFIPGDTDTSWREGEHQTVCDQLGRVLPDEAERLRAISGPTGWAGLRVTTANQFAYATQIEPGLFASLGHGSHGIASAAHAGGQLASLLTNGPRLRATTD